jgi:hypothetical protein
LTSNMSSFSFFNLFYLFIFMVLGFKLRASHLLGKHSTTSATPLAFFVLVTLERGSHFMPRSACTVILFYASNCSWDDRHLPPHPPFSIEMESQELFCQETRNTTLQISPSQVAKIVCVSHHVWLLLRV